MSRNTPDFDFTFSVSNHPEHIAIVTAQWNGHITSKLRDGAVSTLVSRGIPQDNIELFDVPGAVELTYAASRLVESGKYAAVIVFGCVIRGDTPHFDYVCDSVTQGVTALNLRGRAPVIFGLLTVDNEQQALERCGGASGHKGVEAAGTAIAMIGFDSTFPAKAQ